jgi:hypothetical protein
MAANKVKRKKRYLKLVVRRRKDRLMRAWMNIWIKKGIIKG